MPYCCTLKLKRKTQSGEEDVEFVSALNKIIPKRVESSHCS